MKHLLTLVLLSLSLTASASVGTVLRHEVAAVADSNVQRHSAWVFGTTGPFHAHANAVFLKRGSEVDFAELNMVAGPTFKFLGAQVTIPIGLRLRPDRDWKMTQVITKVNAFGRIGDFSWSAVG